MTPADQNAANEFVAKPYLKELAGSRRNVVREPQRVVEDPVVHLIDVSAVEWRLRGEQQRSAAMPSGTAIHK